MKEVHFEAEMPCGGCAATIKRILGKVEGVTNVEADLDKQSVVVTADPSVSNELLDSKLQKWASASGKTVKLVS